MKPITKHQLADAALLYVDAIAYFDADPLDDTRWTLVEHCRGELVVLARQYQQQHTPAGEQLALALGPQQKGLLS